jgi:hypothetical protein
MLLGCAASQQARDVQQSGFLGQDDGLLRPGAGGETAAHLQSLDQHPWSTGDL